MQNKSKCNNANLFFATHIIICALDLLGLAWTTPWLFNIAMENGPFIDDFPIKTSICKGFSMAMLNNQRVIFEDHCWKLASLWGHVTRYFLRDHLVQTKFPPERDGSGPQIQRCNSPTVHRLECSKAQSSVTYWSCFWQRHYWSAEHFLYRWWKLL